MMLGSYEVANSSKLNLKLKTVWVPLEPWAPWTLEPWILKNAPTQECHGDLSASRQIELSGVWRKNMPGIRRIGLYRPPGYHRVSETGTGNHPAPIRITGATEDSRRKPLRIS